MLRAGLRAFGLLLVLPAPTWAGDWQPPVSLPRPEWSSGGTAHAVAADSSGNAVAMVRQARISGTGGAYPLSAATWAVGQPPESPFVLGGFGTDGNVAIDADGNAVAVWIERADGLGVQAAFKPAGGSWQPKQTLSSVPDGLDLPNFGHARLAMSADGHAVATWVLYTSGGDLNGASRVVIQAAVKPAGAATFGPAVDVSPTGPYSEPDVAVAANGDAVVVWDRGVGGAVEAALALRQNN